MYSTPKAHQKQIPLEKAIENLGRALVKNQEIQQFEKWKKGQKRKNISGFLARTAPPAARSQKTSNHDALGLSTAHKWRKTKNGKLDVWLDGSLIRVSKPKPSIETNGGGGIRGRISKFSKSSRRRLMRTVAKTQKEKLPVFVTLTYPAEWPRDPEEWKRHLRNFEKRLAYKFPDVAGIWKLEPQKRGAPHYHLLVWGAEYHDLLGFVGKKWYEVVGSGDEKHLRAGTRVEKVRSWKGVMSYSSKYLGKEVENMPGWENVGRFWGVFFRQNIPWAALVSVEVTYRQACQFMRYLRRYANIKSRDYKSLTIFVENSEYWFDRLDRLL